MLVEFVDTTGDQMWINPKHVIRVYKSGAHTCIETISTNYICLVVIATPADVAAKLNGEAK